jgi:hypothetical protein
MGGPWFKEGTLKLEILGQIFEGEIKAKCFNKTSSLAQALMIKGLRLVKTTFFMT